MFGECQYDENSYTFIWKKVSKIYSLMQKMHCMLPSKTYFEKSSKYKMVNQLTHGRMMSLVVLQFHYSNITNGFSIRAPVIELWLFQSRFPNPFEDTWRNSTMGIQTKNIINMLKRKVTEKPMLKLLECFRLISWRGGASSCIP